jgi:hypothetical protein
MKPDILSTLTTAAAQLAELEKVNAEVWSNINFRAKVREILENADEIVMALEDNERLKRGDFKSEELQGICHGLDETDYKAFTDGCANYQCILFGTSDRADLESRLATANAEIEKLKQDLTLMGVGYNDDGEMCITMKTYNHWFRQFSETEVARRLEASEKAKTNLVEAMKIMQSGLDELMNDSNLAIKHPTLYPSYVALCGALRAEAEKVRKEEG